MKIEALAYNIVKLEKRVIINKDEKIQIIKNIINNYSANSQNIAERWSLLYNVYDYVEGSDIRVEYKNTTGKYNNMIEYLNYNDKINKLFEVAGNLFQKDMENEINLFMERIDKKNNK